MRDKEHVLLGVFVGFVFESFAFGDEFVVVFFECGRNVTKEDEPGENFAVVCRRDVSLELVGGVPDLLFKAESSLCCRILLRCTCHLLTCVIFSVQYN